jgi:P27 family predicted phage terminase small subunit
MKGRKAKPDRVKAIAGTIKPSRFNPDQPDPESGRPEPPSNLSDAAVVEFGRICDRMEAIGTLSPTFVDTIAAAARRAAEIDECQGIIDKEGRIYETVTQNGKMIRPHPAVAQKNEAERHHHALMAELGLTPATMGKVKAQGTGRPANRFAGHGSRKSG